MQEQIIQDLISVMRKSLEEMSMKFIDEAKLNLDILKNPLALVDPIGEFAKELMNEEER